MFGQSGAKASFAKAEERLLRCPLLPYPQAKRSRQTQESHFPKRRTSSLFPSSVIVLANAQLNSNVPS